MRTIFGASITINEFQADPVADANGDFDVDTTDDEFVELVNDGTFFLDLTFITLTMLVVGGMHSLIGACAGVAVVSIVAEAFRAAERGIEVGGHVIEAPSGLQEIALSAILLAILILRPNGLVGDQEISPLTRKKERGA